MSTTTAQKIQHELNSILGLSIINLVAAAMAIAFGVSFLMPNLINVVSAQTVTYDQVGLMILGGLAWAVAMRWLISSAKIIEVQSKLQTELKEHKKQGDLDDETLTGLIVKLAGAYRENKPTFKLMVTISKIAGACFALSSALALANIVMGLLSGSPAWATAAMTTNFAVSAATAAACFIIPHFFTKYTMVWEQRLNQTAKAEAELQKLLGEEEQ